MPDYQPTPTSAKWNEWNKNKAGLSFYCDKMCSSSIHFLPNQLNDLVVQVLHCARCYFWSKPCQPSSGSLGCPPTNPSLTISPLACWKLQRPHWLIRLHESNSCFPFSVPNHHRTHGLGATSICGINLWGTTVILLFISLFLYLKIACLQGMGGKAFWCQCGRIIVVNLASEHFRGIETSPSAIPSSNWTFKPRSFVLLWQIPRWNIVCGVS